MEDSLIREYLETRLTSVHEKELPDKIKLPSGEVLVRNGIKYLDKRGNVYSMGDVKNIIQSQGARRRQNIENSKRWKYKPEDRYNDPDYVDNTAHTYGDNVELRIGDIVFYENPNMKTVVDIMKRNNGCAYAVSENNRILISADSDFCSLGVLRLIQKSYRVEPEKVGIISMSPRGVIYPGVDGDLVLTKGRYSKQIELVKSAFRALIKAYPFLKASPQSDNFFRWVETAFREWHAPIDQFEFIRWLKKGYSEEDYRGPAPTSNRRFNLPQKAFSYNPQRFSNSGLEDQLAIDANQKIHLPTEREIESSHRKIEVEFSGESRKVADITFQAYKDNKINKQEYVKAMMVLRNAVKNKNDKAVYKLKSIILKALKG